jgi:predicted amidohydrolase YtcJ
VYAYLGGAWSAIEPMLREPPDHEGLVQVVGIKLFADGALGSRGAALFSPYSDRPEMSGLLVTPEEDLKKRAAAAHRAGYAVTIHAIGDRGNRMALDALAAAVAAAPAADRPNHRVEHAQVVAPEDIPRFAREHVVASMQPTHATSDMPWAEARVGPERIKGAYAWRTLLNTKATVVFGSDAPGEGESPWLGIYAAVTRMDSEGRPAGGWRPDERVTLTEALTAFSVTPSEVVKAKEIGVLAPGVWADLTIVAADPFAVPVEALKGMRTVRTLVAGREVFAE